MQPTTFFRKSAGPALALLAPLPLRLTPVALGLDKLGLDQLGIDNRALDESALDDEATPPSRTRKDETRALRRIVHMRGGGTVRAVVRRAEDGWEYKKSGKWKRIPLAAIDHVVLERDAEKEWKARWRKAKGDIEARAELGAWSLSNGLLEEGMGTLERVLDEHPDHLIAREALVNHAYRFAVPRVDPRMEETDEGTAELRRWAAGRGLTSRELAILELSRVRDRDGLRALLSADLFAGSFRKRAFAAHALRRLYPGQEMKRMVHRAVLDGSEEVREQAAYALRHASNVGVIVPVANALGSNHPRVRNHAAEALGNMGYASAVEPLMVRLAAVQDAGRHNVPHSYIFFGRQFAYIQDFDVEVAQFQAVADPQINVLIEGSVLDAGVHGVKEVVFASEGRVIRNALEKLTGQDPGHSNRAWLRWWEKNGAQWGAAAMADKAPVYPSDQ